MQCSVPSRFVLPRFWARGSGWAFFTFFGGGGGYNTIQQTLEWIEVVCRWESRQIPPTALEFFFFCIRLERRQSTGHFFLFDFNSGELILFFKISCSKESLEQIWRAGVHSFIHLHFALNTRLVRRYLYSTYPVQSGIWEGLGSAGPVCPVVRGGP